MHKREGGVLRGTGMFSSLRGGNVCGLAHSEVMSDEDILICFCFLNQKGGKMMHGGGRE